MKTLLAIAILGALVWYGYTTHRDKVAAEVSPSTVVDVPGAEPTRLATSPQPAFSCDGRTHCPQMRSCEEATYFLQNCPNVEMDGNGDGVPCEKQWCR